jgi:hypothetical protein
MAGAGVRALNDSGEPDIYAVDANGKVAVGPCP